MFTGCFRQVVWRTLLNTVPFGHTLSYGDLAKRSGYPAASRAVGHAMHCNPIALMIPCHRVILSGGKYGNYAGGEHIKRYLLQHEKKFERD